MNYVGLWTILASLETLKRGRIFESEVCVKSPQMKLLVMSEWSKKQLSINLESQPSVMTGIKNWCQMMLKMSFSIFYFSNKLACVVFWVMIGSNRYFEIWIWEFQVRINCSLREFMELPVLKKKERNQK